MFHLPDLPNAGYATDRERQLTDAIMTFMRDVERDRFRLLTIVVDGPDKWRRVAGSVWAGFQADTELVDSVYRYFLLQACRPITQWLLLAAMKNQDKFRELVKTAMPHIERERETLRLQRKWGVN